jgi:hypothetical protein
MGYTTHADDYEVLDEATYPAVVVSVEHSEEDGKFGPFLAWEFDVFNAETFADVRVSARSGDKLTPSSKAREWTEAVLGRALAKKEAFDFDTLAGMPCRVRLEIEEKEKGTFNKVAKVLPPPPPVAAPVRPAAHVVNEQPSRAAFDARFKAQADAAWAATQQALAPDELAPAPAGEQF